MRRWCRQPKGELLARAIEGRKLEADRALPQDCAGAILYSSDRAVEVTTEAMQSLGGAGYLNGENGRYSMLLRGSQHTDVTSICDPTDYPVGRMLRDARLYTVGAGTQEIRRMLIGRTFNEELA